MEKNRIAIDLNICIRSGQCFYMHPRLVRMRNDGYPEVTLAAGMMEQDMGEALSLIDVCPVGAIAIDGLD